MLGEAARGHRLLRRFSKTSLPSPQKLKDVNALYCIVLLYCPSVNDIFIEWDWLIK